jgi:hypothetical protein
MKQKVKRFSDFDRIMYSCQLFIFKTFLAVVSPHTRDTYIIYTNIYKISLLAIFLTRALVKQIDYI